MGLAAHGPFIVKIIEARAKGDNELFLDLIAQARDALGDRIGTDWNVPLEIEALLTLGRPFDALDRYERYEAQMAGSKVRSVTFGFAYWFSGYGEEAIGAIEALFTEEGRFHGIERSWLATVQLFRRYRGIGSLPAPADDTYPDHSPYSSIVEGLAEVAARIDAGDDDGAGTLVADLIERWPPTDGLTTNAWFIGSSAWYVLRPDDRPLLDAIMTEQLFAEGNAVYRSFVLGRELGRLPDGADEGWPTPGQVGTILPRRWAVEIALRLPPSLAVRRDAILDTLHERGLPSLQAFAAGDGPGAGAGGRGAARVAAGGAGVARPRRSPGRCGNLATGSGAGAVRPARSPASGVARAGDRPVVAFARPRRRAKEPPGDAVVSDRHARARPSEAGAVVVRAHRPADDHARAGRSRRRPRPGAAGDRHCWRCPVERARVEGDRSASSGLWRLPRPVPRRARRRVDPHRTVGAAA